MIRSMDDSSGPFTLTFDSQNPEFLRGFEAGLIWSYAYNLGALDAVIHSSNAEMVMRICEVLDLPFRGEPVNDGLIRIQVGRGIDS